MAQGPSEIAATRAPSAWAELKKALEPPLRFARNAGPSRLQGLEALVRNATQAARGRVDSAALDALCAVAQRVDGLPDGEKLLRIERLATLLNDGPPAAAAPTPTPTPVGDPNVLASPLQFLKGIGPKRAEELAERGLRTLGDALALIPRGYEDRRSVVRIADLQADAMAVVCGTVVASSASGFARGRRFEVALDDGSGVLRLVYFHFRAAEMQKRFVRGSTVTAVGEVQVFGARRQMVHPKTALGDNTELLGGVHPIYSELQGMHPTQVARVVQSALVRALAEGITDPLPDALRRRAQVVPLADALRELHQPKDDVTPAQLQALLARRSAGHTRMAFEELLVFGTALARKRSAAARDRAPPLTVAASGSDDAAVAEIQQLLPFAPTGAQRRAIHEVLADLASDVPMARLLQGDVGSGKTAVAAVACLRAVRAGHQAAFMAPTELLAEQHARTLVKWLTPLGVRAEIVTGSKAKKARALAEARLRSRDIDVVIGTQALLSEGVGFARLGLCVIDEQHRFGVVQRAALKDKGPDGKVPHLLVMTATPIPRSLALTAYGDLSVSVLDELPPGRTPVHTVVIKDGDAVTRHIADALERDEGAFVVYPLIDASAKLDAQAAMEGFAELQRQFGARVALLHGRMDAAEREAVMGQFVRGQTRVLVSTTVVEVGVDVPDATLMVIKDAERFGLAQLHQLRGRVGRSHRSSRCVLVVGGGVGEDARRRLQVLEQTNDGFRIAEEDLAQRGPGDLLGTRQSGLPSMAFADLVRHAPLIELTRQLGEELIAADPELARPEHAGLKRLVEERYAPRLLLTEAG